MNNQKEKSINWGEVAIGCIALALGIAAKLGLESYLGSLDTVDGIEG